MTSSEISYILLLVAVLWFGIMLGSLTDSFRKVRRKLTEKLIYELWCTLDTDCVTYADGEIVFVENCDVERTEVI